MKWRKIARSALQQLAWNLDVVMLLIGDLVLLLMALPHIRLLRDEMRLARRKKTGGRWPFVALCSAAQRPRRGVMTMTRSQLKATAAAACQVVASTTRMSTRADRSNGVGVVGDERAHDNCAGVCALP